MSPTISGLFNVVHPDADVRRRARNMILIAIGLAICSLLLVVLWVVQKKYAPAGAAAAIALSAIISFTMLRGRMITQVAMFQSLVLVLVIFAQIISVNSLINGGFYLLVPLLVGISTLTPRQFLSLTGIAFVGYLACCLKIAQQIGASTAELNAFQDTLFLITFTGLVGAISVLNAHQAAHEIAHARAQNEVAAGALAQANASLETKIAERTRELAETLGRERSQTVALQESLARQRDLDNLVNTLALPVIPVRPDVLVVPLVGSVDTSRISQLLGQILEQIERHRASTIVLDVTGVAIIDTQLAQSILHIAASARLLGTRTIMAGVRPEVAQSLVSLGADLSAIETAATLYEGLQSIKRPTPY